MSLYCRNLYGGLIHVSSVLPGLAAKLALDVPTVRA